MTGWRHVECVVCVGGNVLNASFDCMRDGDGIVWLMNAHATALDERGRPAIDEAAFYSATSEFADHMILR